MPSIPQTEEIVKQARSDFYIYALINSLTGKIFYIGKGKGNRMECHERQARRGMQSHKCNMIRKIWNDGGEVLKKKIAYFTDSEEAYRFEQHLIASIGRENLTNATDGGDGTRGRVYSPSPESRAKTSASHKGIPKSPEHRAKIGKAHKGRIFSEETRRKMSLSDMGRKHTPEQKAKRKATLDTKGWPASKIHSGFLSPDGALYTDIYNLAAFCREHDLSATSMYAVDNGERKSHKGWVRYPPLKREEKPPTYAKAGFISPDGRVYEAHLIPNLTAFCREHGLNRTCMAKVAQGKQHEHKGWTRYDPDIDQPTLL